MGAKNQSELSSGSGGIIPVYTICMTHDATKPTCGIKDRVQVLSAPNEKGEILCVRHHADHTKTVGVLTMRDEESGHKKGDLALKATGLPGAYDVVGTITHSTSGPAKVNTKAFHDGWEALFGNRTKHTAQA